MSFIQTYFRLGLGGLLLNPHVYREQRDASNGLQRGLILVLLVGLLVGVTGMIGRIGEILLSPAPDAVVQTVYTGLTKMPWYSDLVELDPSFRQEFEQQFRNASGSIMLLSGGGIGQALARAALAPLFGLLGWFIFGGIAHATARLLGGRGSFSQSLAAIALASATGVLGIVQVIPFAQVAATTLFGLIACYVAIREVHELAPARAFWAVMLVPVLLATLGLCALCGLFVLALSSLRG